MGELHRSKIRLQNKTTGLGLDGGRGGGRDRDGPGHHRSYSTSGPPSSSSSRQWAGQQPPRTPPAFNQGNHGGYGHMSQMSPMGYQMPYGFPIPRRFAPTFLRSAAGGFPPKS